MVMPKSRTDVLMYFVQLIGDPLGYPFGCHKILVWRDG